MTACDQPFCKNPASWILLVHPLGSCESGEQTIKHVASCGVCRRDWESDLINMTHNNTNMPMICKCDHLIGDFEDIIVGVQPLVSSS